MGKSQRLRFDKETKLQAAIFKEVFILEKTDPRWKMVFAMPSQGSGFKGTKGLTGNALDIASAVNKNNMFRGVQRQREGARKGLPDIFILVPVAGFHGMVIELKLPNKELRPEQLEYINLFKKYGYLAGAISTDDPAFVIRFITAYFLDGAKDFRKVVVKKSSVKQADSEQKEKK